MRRPTLQVWAALIALGVFTVVGLWLWGAGSLLVLPMFAFVLLLWTATLLVLAIRSLFWAVLVPFATTVSRLAHIAWTSIARDRDGRRIHAAATRMAVRLRPLTPVIRWTIDRLRPGRGGLRRTVPAAFFTAAGLALWRLGSELGRAGLVAGIDERIADMAGRLNGSAERVVMLGLTEAGRTRIMLLITGVLVVGALLAGARRSAILLLAITATSAAAVTVLKAAVDRPRPGLGLLVEVSSSWPSGHASAGLALALAVVIAWRAAGMPRWPALAGLVVPVGMLIGYSRAYLTVHWATDVIGGWLVAAMAAALVMFLDDVVAAGPGNADVAVRPRRLTAAGMAAVAVFVTAGALGSDTQLPEIPAPPVVELTSTDPASVLEAVSPFSETLMGHAIEPIALVIAGTEGTVRSAVAAAGWSVADDPTFRRLLGVYWAGLRGGDDLTAPVTPTFHDGRMQDLAIEKPLASGAGSSRRRHHARMWRLDTVIGDGCPVWVVTASLDDRTEWTWRTVLPNHHIAPAIDEEQRFLAAELVGTGFFVDRGTARVTEPTMGTNGAGDPWFTDGTATVLASVSGCDD